MTAANPHLRSVLGDPALRRDLAHTVRRRLDRVEVEDVVQAALVEALAAKAPPTAAEEIRRFVFAIARQKVADHYRRRGREQRHLPPESDFFESPPDDLKLWIERALPEAEAAEKTFEWMLREAEGESLAEIAAADRVSAPMVRQRVSRLRRWLSARWVKEVAGFTALVILAALAALAHRATIAKHELPEIRRDELGTSLTKTPPLPPPIPSHSAPTPPAPLPVVAPTAPPPPPPRTSGSAKTTLWYSVSSKSSSSSGTFAVTVSKADMLRCATASSPRGISHLSVAFGPDGIAKHVTVDSGVAAGRPEAACIERLFAHVTIAPYEGRSYTAGTYFTLVPEPLPKWIEPPAD